MKKLIWMLLAVLFLAVYSPARTQGTLSASGEGAHARVVRIRHHHTLAHRHHVHRHRNVHRHNSI